MGSVEEDKYTNKDGTIDLHGNPAVKNNTGNWKACPYILENECCERLANYGMGTNPFSYMTDRFHQGNVTAANNVTNWSGRMGLTLLTLSASVKGLKPSCANGACHPSQSQSAVFFMSLDCYRNRRD